MPVRAAAMLQPGLQGGAREEAPAGTPGRHLSSPRGDLPILPAAAAAQPHPGKAPSCGTPRKGASGPRADTDSTLRSPELTM